MVLLPTSIFRGGNIATKVDLFIVPDKQSVHGSSKLSDLMMARGHFIGLRLAQTSVDSSDLLPLSGLAALEQSRLLLFLLRGKGKTSLAINSP